MPPVVKQSIWKNGPSAIWTFKGHVEVNMLTGSGIWDPRSEMLWIEIVRTDRAAMCGYARRTECSHAHAVEPSLGADTYVFLAEIPAVDKPRNTTPFATQHNTCAPLCMAHGAHQLTWRCNQIHTKEKHWLSRKDAWWALLRGGEGVVDWDIVGSNCSIDNCLSNCNKRTSSKSSNWEIWARWGFQPNHPPFRSTTRSVCDASRRRSWIQTARQRVYFVVW